jgi:ankyrin repeat protein
VALLLARGADVDAAQRGGYTPLRSAAANGDLARIGLLIDAARLTDDGKTAGALANKRGHPEIARRLDDALEASPRT